MSSETIAEQLKSRSKRKAKPKKDVKEEPKKEETKEAPKKKSLIESLMETTMSVDNVDNDLTALSELIGDWKVGPLYSMGGESQSGKTTLTIQLAAEYSHKTGKKFLLFDTEGGGSKFLDAWMPIHKKKYPKADGMAITCRLWEDILAVHGTVASQTVSKPTGKTAGGKIKVIVEKVHAISEMDEFVKKNNIGCIVYDSFTMPMQAFGSNQENFPSRNSVQQMWFHAMIGLADKYGVLIIVNNHMSRNPTDPYRRPEVAGGKAIAHNCKVQFWLRKWEAKGVTKYRTLKLDRFYSVAKGEKEKHIELTDDGYVDRTEEDMTSARQRG